MSRRGPGGKARPEPPAGGAKSHVNQFGVAKVCYASIDEAQAAADLLWINKRKATYAYLCWQKPDHYHLSTKPSDLKGTT